MDDPATLLAAQKDPMGFIQDLGNHVIIDEIQRVPELFLPIKKLVDQDRENRRYILTGSADVMLLPKVGDSLAGRIEVHHLWPFSQDEINQKPSTFIETLIGGGKFNSSKTSWNQIASKIAAGGYPASLQRSSPKRRNKWFEDYLSAILQKDIKELSNIEGLTEIPNILSLIATRVGSTTNMSEIARLSGVKNTTFKRYLALLEHVFLILKVPAWTKNTEGQFVKSPKYISMIQGS